MFVYFVHHISIINHILINLPFLKAGFGILYNVSRLHAAVFGAQNKLLRHDLRVPNCTKNRWATTIFLFKMWERRVAACYAAFAAQNLNDTLRAVRGRVASDQMIQSRKQSHSPKWEHKAPVKKGWQQNMNEQVRCKSDDPIQKELLRCWFEEVVGQKEKRQCWNWVWYCSWQMENGNEQLPQKVTHCGDDQSLYYGLGFDLENGKVPYKNCNSHQDDWENDSNCGADFHSV